MTAESIAFGGTERRRFSSEDKKRWCLYIVSLLIVLATGAIAALGSHLAPSESLLEGLSKDLSTESHLAVRLRFLHPMFALGLTTLLALFMPLHLSGRPTSSRELWYRRFGMAVIAAIFVGIGTLVLLAPLWLKVTHLLMTNLLVVGASLCIFHTLRPVPREDPSARPS
jgi:heme A synthase